MIALSLCAWWNRLFYWLPYVVWSDPLMGHHSHRFGPWPTFCPSSTNYWRTPPRTTTSITCASSYAECPSSAASRPMSRKRRFLMIANSPEDWELFVFEDAGNGNVKIKNIWGRYVDYEPSGFECTADVNSAAVFTPETQGRGATLKLRRD